MSIEPAARAVLRAQAALVVAEERGWQRAQAANATEGDPTRHPDRSRSDTARHLLGLGVAAAMHGTPVPRRLGMSAEQVWGDMVFMATERLLDEVRVSTPSPSSDGYRDRCLWCGRDRHAGTGETPIPQPGDRAPTGPDEPPRLWHTSCWHAFGRGQDLVDCLYRNCPDEQLVFLDELLIAVGYLRRCYRCAAMAPVESACADCGAPAQLDAYPVDGVEDWFATYRTVPERVWTLPTRADTDPPMRLGIAALGGGTPGHAYAHNSWIYGLWVDGRLTYCGTDLRAGAAARTHRQMAVLVAEYLTVDHTVDEAVRLRLADWLASHDADGDGQ